MSTPRSFYAIYSVALLICKSAPKRALHFALFAALLAFAASPAPLHAAGERKTKSQSSGKKAKQSQARAAKKAQAARSLAPKQSAEARLLQIYRLIGKGSARQALAQADALVVDHPDFKLAHLVRGDLLLAMSGKAGPFGNVTAAGIPANSVAVQGEVVTPRNPRASEGITNTTGANLTLIPATLPELKQEAELRMRSLQERPAADAIPTPFVDLPEHVDNALLVDLSRARLYHYTNVNGKLTLAQDFYITHGRLGPDKSFEGDQKTPLGVYFITRNISAKSLNNFYGAGALPINFPNEYDRRRNRTGSGIWLHGVPNGPKGTFARPPRASDGCVVLSNTDLQNLLNTIKPGDTPIVIVPKATWITPAAQQVVRSNFTQLLANWQSARAKPQSAAFKSFYSHYFQSNNQKFDEWAKIAYGQPALGEMQRATVLYYPSNDELLVTTFFDPVARGKQTVLVKKRLYWHKINGKWQIFFEGPVTI